MRRARGAVGAAVCAALVALFAVGCGGEDGDDDDDGDFPDYPPSGTRQTLEVGTGEDTFVPFADGETLPLVAGIQGGWHVWISLRIDGLRTGERSWMELVLEPADGAVPEQTSRTRPAFQAASDGAATIVGWAAQISRPSCFIGEATQLRALVVDQDETWGEATRTFVVGPGASPPTEPCNR